MKIGKRWLISDVIIADFLGHKGAKAQRFAKGFPVCRQAGFVSLCAFAPLWRNF